MYVCIVIMAIVLLVPNCAHAGYLDPGSGSTLVQGIVAFFASISRFFRNLFRRNK